MVNKQELGFIKSLGFNQSFIGELINEVTEANECEKFQSQY